MTVLHGAHQTLRADGPGWSQLPSGGYYRMASSGGRHDRHFHDFNEWYFVCRGRAKVLNAGVTSYVRAGDMVGIRAGDEHDILEIYGDEDLELFWLYEPGPAGGRLGHLYRGSEADAWHEVPSLPLPADFPDRTSGEAPAGR